MRLKGPKATDHNVTEPPDHWNVMLWIENEEMNSFPEEIILELIAGILDE